MIYTRVGALIIREAEEPEILLIRHRRRGRHYWVLPGGKVENGETVEQAFIREVNEETGLDVEMGRPLYIADVITPNNEQHAINLIFLGTVRGGTFRHSLKNNPIWAELGDKASYVPLSHLTHEALYPPLSSHIIDAYGNGFQVDVQYMGNIWKEFIDEKLDR